MSDQDPSESSTTTLPKPTTHNTDKPKRRPRTKPTNPLQSGIFSFLTKHNTESNNLVPTQALPKRYTLYPPLLLLPANFTTYSPQWQHVFEQLSGTQKGELWTCIVREFGDGRVSHVALNAPIEAEVGGVDEVGGRNGGDDDSDDKDGDSVKVKELEGTANGFSVSMSNLAVDEAALLTRTQFEAETSGSKRIENTLRAPTNLIPLYGDFGPETLFTFTSSTDRCPTKDIPLKAPQYPTQRDFDAAFWVSTTIPYNFSQLTHDSIQDGQVGISKKEHEKRRKGIVQTWAPRWIMFSRGNVREKERILLSHQTSSFPAAEVLMNDAYAAKQKHYFPGLSGCTSNELSGQDVVDFYVGIGYFASCYLARGIRRVYGWDINPWSIEGLRRGCEANGWGCVIVQVGEDGAIDPAVRKVVQQVREKKEEETMRCVAFLGDNKFAASVLKEIQSEMEKSGCKKEDMVNVRHVNLGLLPSSKLSWENAVSVLNENQGGWLHVHENVDVHEIQEKEKVVVEEITRLVRGDRGEDWEVQCEHVEQVKTYAPGVMHCVFDIVVSPSSTRSIRDNCT